MDRFINFKPFSRALIAIACFVICLLPSRIDSSPSNRTRRSPDDDYYPSRYQPGDDYKGSYAPDDSYSPKHQQRPYNPPQHQNQHPDAYNGGGKTDYDAKSYFVEYVIDLSKDKYGGPYDVTYGTYWKADCNGYNYGYDYGWITAIWDDYEFKDLDYIKCAGTKKESYTSSYGSGNDYGYKLDFYDQRLLNFYDKSDSSATRCYRGYLLTALWSDDYDFKNIKYGKCTKLDHGIIDYSYCDNFDTSYKQGGTYEAYKKWNVECPNNWAAIGLQLDSYYKIEHLRCCKLVLPQKYGHQY